MFKFLLIITIQILSFSTNAQGLTERLGSLNRKIKEQQESKRIDSDKDIEPFILDTVESPTAHQSSTWFTWKTFLISSSVTAVVVIFIYKSYQYTINQSGLRRALQQ